MRFKGLLVASGVLLVSAGAEGQIEARQFLEEGNKGVMWVDTGGEVPLNAIRVQVDGGLPLCRGIPPHVDQETAGDDYYAELDIGVYWGEGVCQTLRNHRRQEGEFFFLVPTGLDDTPGQVDEEDIMVPLRRVKQMRAHMLAEFHDLIRRGRALSGDEGFSPTQIMWEFDSADGYGGMKAGWEDWHEFEYDGETYEAPLKARDLRSGPPRAKTGPPRSKTGPPRSKTGPPRSKTGPPR